MENRLPSISLIDSAGAFLPLQAEIFPDHDQKKVVFARLRKAYEEIRSKPNSYENFELKNIPTEQKFNFKTEAKDGLGLGLCPVASEKTRCCNS